MRSVAEALAAVLEQARPLPPRPTPLAGALGLMLAEDVAADLDLPPFDKALVDGYAVRSADLDGRHGVPLRIGEEITAGRTPSRPLEPGEAAVVMTGAPLPHGADAVIMHERTERDGASVVLLETVVAGQNRLTRGREMRAGEVVLRRGERLNAARIGLLASVGRAAVGVHPAPVVAVVPTGDELVPCEQTPGPGQIRNSNAEMLAALVRSAGAIARTAPIAPDEPGPLREILAAALDGESPADVLLISGGVSAGKRDLVPGALESLGIGCLFHKVNVKPGKPLWFGVGRERPGGSRPLVFGLPGNPVSGVVSGLLFVLPALRVLMGGPPEGPRRIDATLATPYHHRGDRPTYHPARLLESRGRPLVEPLAWAGSADLRTVAAADGFAAFPAGDREHAPGTPVEFLPWPVRD